MRGSGQSPFLKPGGPHPEANIRAPLGTLETAGARPRAPRLRCKRPPCRGPGEQPGTGPMDDRTKSFPSASADALTRHSSLPTAFLSHPGQTSTESGF